VKEGATTAADPADRLWTIDDLAARWGFADELARNPAATRRRVRDMSKRLRVKAVVLSLKEVRFRPVDVLKAEEAAARR
jgi:hypothetical protein